MERAFQNTAGGCTRGKKLIEAGALAIQDALARRYGYRGPFDPQLIDDIENPYREALLIALLQDGDPDDKRMLSGLKYIKSLLNVHGTAMVRSQGVKIDNIFMDDSRHETKSGRTVRHTFVMEDGTVVKVMGNG